MDSVRHVLAILVAIAYSPAIAYWFAVHPFIAFWRRRGPATSFTILLIGYLALAYACWTLRAVLIGRDLGTHWPIVATGLVVYALGAAIDRAARKHLRFTTLAGLPEIRGTGDPTALLQTGVYGRIRHPRYAGFMVGAIGIALVVHYTGIYLMTAVLIPTLYLVLLLEERELADRFGPAWLDYSARVPRLLPRSHFPTPSP